MASTLKRTAKHAVLPLAACTAAALGALTVPPAVAQAQSQRIAVDPQTGQLRAPELDELSRAAPSAMRAAPSGARVATPNEGAKRLNSVQFGAKGFRTDPNRMSFTVVRRGADGSISTECVTGETAATHAMHRVASGGRHEH